MPRLTEAYPRYRKHRASGQAVVSIGGNDIYLGPYGTKTSRLEYDKVIAEWLANGRTMPRRTNNQADLTVVELAAAYKRFAEGYYRKHGKVSREVSSILSAIGVIKRLYGREQAKDFGPIKLQAVQQAMIATGWSRRHINKQVGRIVRMFRWGVVKEMIPANTAQALREVPGLYQGRTDAREAVPVLPVSDSIVNATIEHLPPIVADMVRLQRLTGCRPEEVCLIRPCDVDTSGAVWSYRPESHKTQHRGRERVIFIGPKGQDILRPYLLREKSAYCFSPAEGERKRRADLHEQRVVPIGYGNRPGTNKRRKPARSAGGRYTSSSYRRAIHRGCELAFDMPLELRTIDRQRVVDPQTRKKRQLTTEEKKAKRKLASQWRDQHCWSPNRLRHAAATEIRKRFGLEAAQVTLGHSMADVTQVYAERDHEKAQQVAREVG